MGVRVREWAVGGSASQEGASHHLREDMTALDKHRRLYNQEEQGQVDTGDL